MLVLSRRVGEWIEINGPCRITITKIKQNGSVHVGIEADQSVEIVRKEIRTSEATARVDQ